jgi:hypothetical protein
VAKNETRSTAEERSYCLEALLARFLTSRQLDGRLLRHSSRFPDGDLTSVEQDWKPKWHCPNQGMD